MKTDHVGGIVSMIDRTRSGQWQYQGQGGLGGR